MPVAVRLLASFLQWRLHSSACEEQREEKALRGIANIHTGTAVTMTLFRPSVSSAARYYRAVLRRGKGALTAVYPA